MYNSLCINCITAIKIAYRLDQTELFNLPNFRIPTACHQFNYFIVYDDAVYDTLYDVVYDTPTTMIMYKKYNDADHLLA